MVKYFLIKEEDIMYAIVKTGGKQYRVEPGEVIKVEKINGNAGEPVIFKDVLLVSNGGQLKVGKPCLEGIQVKGTILAQGRNKKVVVFKLRRRKRYRKKMGHRQYFTAIKIEEIKEEGHGT
jgi:large subunit ribosomal protein L21